MNFGCGFCTSCDVLLCEYVDSTAIMQYRKIQRDCLIKFPEYWIGKKRQYLLQVGYLDYPRMPIEYWKNRKEKALAPTNIHIYRGNETLNGEPSTVETKG